MTTYSVSTASQLTSTLNLAQAGDVISLAGGSYGDVTISKSFSSDVTITSASDSSPAVFRSLLLDSSSHIHLNGLTVNYTPDASTDTWSSAVEFNNSNHITFTHSTVTGGAAVTGVPQSATTLDASGNVIGLPTARGILVGRSSDVLVDGVEVSKFFKGIVLGTSDNVTLSHNDVHDTRTTPIVSGGGNHITIDANHMHDVNPWRFGPSGDHADYLALWTNASQTVASTDIKITNNLMEQGQGQPVLGMWLQGDAAGFTNVQVTGNAILGGHFEGLVFWDVHGGVIANNILLQTSGTNSETAPIILLSTGAQNISVHDNNAAAVTDESGSAGTLANSIGVNSIVQKWSPTAAGYYTNDLILTTETTYDAIVAGGSPTPTPAPTPAPPPVTNLTLEGTWAYQTLTGGDGNDTFISKSGGDTLVGGAGDDTYNFSASKTLVVEAAGGGVDTVVVQGDYTLTANVENLTISTTAANNWAGTGNGLNNVITGNAGGNYLDGMAGADTINGGAGADHITGGLGDDQLTGGSGKDTFRFAKGSGQDVITDFSKADHDVLDLWAYLKSGYKPVLTDVGADVKISFATGDAITLTGVHAKDLIANSHGFTI